MEPHNVPKHLETCGEGNTSLPSQQEKRRRFQLVKLEERIAPSKGGAGTNNGCVLTGTCFCHLSHGGCWV
jgi:hypothetical protein